MEETKRKTVWYFISRGVALVGLAAFTYVVWSAYDHEAVMRWIHGLQPLPYFLLISVLPAIGFPTTPLYILAGASFGIAVGLIGTWIALAVNAALCFAVARWMRPRFERLVRRFRTEVPDTSRRERSDLRLALGVKLAPGAPTFVKQYALGLSGISFRLYMTVTMLVSGAFVAAFVVIGESLLDHRPGRTAGAVIVLAVAIAGTIWYSRRKSRASRLPPGSIQPQPA